jgi:hypothetical protein
MVAGNPENPGGNCNALPLKIIQRTQDLFKNIRSQIFRYCFIINPFSDKIKDLLLIYGVKSGKV